MVDIKKFVQDSQEIEQEVGRREWQATNEGAYQIVFAFLRLQGVVYPDKGCFCDKEGATDEEVRSYYTSLFSALRHFGFSDPDLRAIVAKHCSSYAFAQDEDPLDVEQDELDPLDVESWVVRRKHICSTNLGSWSALVARHLLGDGK